MKILSILLFFFMGLEISLAQTPHKPILDDPKVKYYDLEGRPVQPGFFKEINMGFRMYFIMEITEPDTVIRKKVWIDTIGKDKNNQTSN